MRGRRMFEDMHCSSGLRRHQLLQHHHWHVWYLRGEEG
jgi:hypothetical protein